PPRPRGCLPTCCLGCRFWGAARSTPSTLRFASCAATGQSAGPEKPERFAFPQGPGRRAHPIDRGEKRPPQRPRQPGDLLEQPGEPSVDLERRMLARFAKQAALIVLVSPPVVRRSGLDEVRQQPVMAPVQALAEEVARGPAL